MNLYEFNRALVRAAKDKGIDKVVLDAVAQAYASRENLYPNVVAEAMQMAAQIQAGLPAKDKGQIFSFVPGTRETMDSELICDALEPRIVAIRERFFESKDPPFPGTKDDPLAGMSKIDEWLEVRTGRPTSRSKVDQRRIFTLAAELQRLTGSTVGFHKQVIEFPHKNPRTSHWESKALSVSTDSPVFELANRIQELKSSGFSATSLTGWVFTGLRPIIPRMTVFTGVSWSEGMPSPRWFTEITINAQDVSWEELWNLYRSLRKTGNLKRRKLSPLHSRICQIVRERGGPPVEHRQKTAFWKSIQAQLIKEKKFASIPGTWEGIRKAYVVATRKDKSDGR